MAMVRPRIPRTVDANTGRTPDSAVIYGARTPHFPTLPRYVSCFVNHPMQPTQTESAPTAPTGEDIIFQCEQCETPLVVDAAAAGLAVSCQRCGKPTRVPDRKAELTAENEAKISDLQRQLKENESQRTEITSYINQHSIQLHRWQLRLKDLNDRKAKLDAELEAVSDPAP